VNNVAIVVWIIHRREDRDAGWIARSNTCALPGFGSEDNPVQGSTLPVECLFVGRRST